MDAFGRYLYVQIVSAEPEKILSKLISFAFELQDVRYVDLLTIELRIKQNQWGRIQKILEKSGASGKVICKDGFLWSAFAMLKRPVLITGILVFLIFASILPGRIFFVEVSGNDRVPDRLILEQAEVCGIQFGVRAKSVRSEIVKNALLEKLPQLQWLGITTSGCVATIQVEERSGKEIVPDERWGVSSILALRDGVVSQLTISQGNPLVQMGQTVKKGDVLVSGYTDCGIKLRAEEARAEIFAYTLRENTFVSLSPVEKRGDFSRKHTCYRLRIGKKVINLCNHSGIHTTSCVKMYLEDYWNLPGGFALPVSLIKVEYLIYEQETFLTNKEQDFSWMASYARSYLSDQMIAGKILTEDLQWELSNDNCWLLGRYSCNEMIGQVKYEEIIEPNAEDN